MEAMLKNGSQYDWKTWLMGIWRAMIGGGAGAVAGLVTNLGTGLQHTLVSMGEAFTIVAVVHMFIFLQTHPGPDTIQVATVKTTTEVTPVDESLPTTRTTTTTPVLGLAHTPEDRP